MEDREIIENAENAECEIVKEVREIRHKISERFNHDVGQLIAHYQALEKKCGSLANIGSLTCRMKFQKPRTVSLCQIILQNQST